MKTINQFHVSKSRHLVLFALILAVFVGLRLWNLSAYGLWLDECFSLTTVSAGWSELFRLTIEDAVHPPLFYIFLKIWLLFGDSLLWLKLFPFFFSMAGVPVLFLLLGELKLSLPVKNTIFFFIAVNPLLIYHAQEVRMYSQLLFFVLVSLWLFVKLSESPQPKSFYWILFFAANLCLVYTQYFGWLVLAIEFALAILFAVKNLKYFILLYIGVAIFFLPWLNAVAVSFARKNGLQSNLGWLTKPTAADVIWFFGELNGNINFPHATFVGTVIFSGILIAAIVVFARGRSKTQTKNFIFFAAFAFAPVFISVAASYLLPQPIFGDRYLIIVVVPYFIIVTIAIYAVSRHLKSYFPLFLILFWYGATNFYTLANENQRTDWRGITSFISENSDAPAPRIYSFEDWAATPLKQNFALQRAARFEVQNKGLMPDDAEKSFWLVFRKLPAAVENTLQTRDCRPQREIINQSASAILFFCVK